MLKIRKKKPVPVAVAIVEVSVSLGFPRIWLMMKAGKRRLSVSLTNELSDSLDKILRRLHP